MSKSAALAACAAAGIALLAAAPAHATSEPPASSTTHVRVVDPTGDVTGSRSGHGRVDIAAVNVELGQSDGFTTKSVKVTTRFAEASRERARIRDVVRVYMTSGDRTFLFISRPMMFPGHQLLPSMNVYEVYNDGSHVDIVEDMLRFDPGPRAISMEFAARDLRRVGVDTIDSVRVGIVRADKALRDQTVSFGPLPLD